MVSNAKVIVCIVNRNSRLWHYRIYFFFVARRGDRNMSDLYDYPTSSCTCASMHYDIHDQQIRLESIPIWIRIRIPIPIPIPIQIHSIRHVKRDGKIRSDTAVVCDNNTINDTNNKKKQKGMKEKQIQNEYGRDKIIKIIMICIIHYNTSFCYE